MKKGEEKTNEDFSAVYQVLGEIFSNLANAIEEKQNSLKTS